MSKTLYHSALCQLGEVAVTVKSDVLTSKFKKDQRYVVLVVDGEEKNYNCENDNCADFFDGQKGASFVLLAEGSREEAVLTYVGDAEPMEAAAQRAPAKAPQPARAAAKGKPPAGKSAAPPPATTTPKPSAKPPVQNGGGHYTPNGQTVGMALNQACEYNRREDPNGVFDGRRVTEIASRLLEISRWLERGNLLPKQVAPPPGKPELSDNDGGAS